MKPVRQLLLCCAIAGICSTVANRGGTVFAQSGGPELPSFTDEPETQFEANQETTKSQPASAKKRTETGPTTILRGDDGKRIAVPTERTMRGYLEYLRTRNEPLYAVNSIEMSGKADRTRAELTATLKVQVLDDRGWVIVPLGLNEAVLKDTTYEFLGPDLNRKKKEEEVGEQAFFKQTTTEGMIWWFKGYGYHKLTLTLLVPLVKQSSHRRLKLTNPPQTASSTLNLQVAVPSVQLSVSRAKEKETDPDPDIIGTGRSSVISVTGLGDQLDLQWRELPPQRRAGKILRADTYVVLKLSEDSAVMTAEQRIKAVNKVSFLTVEVQLPTGFVVSRVEGQYYVDHTIDANNRAVVTLSEARTEETKLRWTLRRKSKLLGGQLAIAGFDIERARFQAGEIAIEKVQGLHIAQLDKESRQIERKPVSEFGGRDLVSKVDLSGVYEFTQQPFRLGLSVTRVAPNLTVTPQMTLRIDKERMELNGKFTVKVSEEGGTVEELLIDWPNRKAENWENIVISGPSLVEPVQLGGKANRRPIHVKFSKRQSKTFVLSVAASRNIATGGKLFPLSMPTMSAEKDKLETTSLKIIHNASQEIRLETKNDQTVLTERNRGAANSLERNFDIEQQAAAGLMLGVSTHQQEITTTTTLDTDVRAGRLHVTQKIFYDVRYVSLAKVRFKLPTELKARFFTSDNKQISPVDTGLPVGGRTELTFKMIVPARGRFEFIVQFDVAIDNVEQASADIATKVPIIDSSDAPYSDVHFEVQESRLFEPAINDPKWQLVNQVDRNPRWKAQSSNGSVPLTLKPTKIPRTDGFTVSRALMQSAVDLTGRVRARAQYRVESNPSTIVMLFPKRLTAEAFWWGRKKLEPEISENTDDNLTVYRLDLPQTSSNVSQWLTVDFHDRNGTPFRWFAAHEIPAPRFPPNVWIEQTVWQVTLPLNHHLFSNPPGYVARFEWARRMLFWKRQRTESSENDAARFSVENGPPPRNDFVQGNLYEFSCYGPAQTLSFDSMNRSLIVLFGAGFAWIAGILLVKLPFMRSVVALLTSSLAIAVAGVWYLVQVQVLLQPAILGLFLAALLVWIERRMKRPQNDSAVLTISQPSDFLQPEFRTAASNTAASPYAGSEDATAVRPALVPYRDSTSTSDVKSHS